MTNPYKDKPDHQFWRKAVSSLAITEVDPVTAPRFKIAPDDQIATAGSCFAQHISRTLSTLGYGYMVTEDKPAYAFSAPENYGTFSARYGNIYTIRQLLQLMKRAYSVFEPEGDAWLREDGRYIDPFRPRIQSGGFETIAQLRADREAHFASVRTLFEDCDVFIFTLGLTEAWLSPADGAVYPLAPGVVVRDTETSAAKFHNFNVAEMGADLETFLEMLKGINPEARVILTVSPVPLIATFECRHVLTATTYSKSALRVVAEEIIRRFDWVDYFPSYEMITGSHARSGFYESDLREVTPEGVAYVMGAFTRNYLVQHNQPPLHEKNKPPTSKAALSREMAVMDAIGAVICDEEAIEASL